MAGPAQLIARMADAAVVTSRADHTDGRATLIAVTQVGRNSLKFVHQTRVDLITRHVPRLTAKHRVALGASAEVAGGPPGAAEA